MPVGKVSHRATGRHFIFQHDMTPEQKTKQSTRESLHRLYQEMTGLTVSFIQREFAWAEWMNRGLDADDLRRWINEVRQRINKGQLDWRSLQFTNLISNMDRAEENCIELRRRMKGRIPDTNRASVLRSANRPEVAAPQEAKPIAAVLKMVESPAKFEQAMMKFKEENRRLGL